MKGLVVWWTFMDRREALEWLQRLKKMKGVGETTFRFKGPDCRPWQVPISGLDELAKTYVVMGRLKPGFLWKEAIRKEWVRDV